MSSRKKKKAQDYRNMQIPSSIYMDNDSISLLNPTNKKTNFSEIVDESRLYQKNNISYSNFKTGFDTDFLKRARYPNAQSRDIIPVGKAGASTTKAIGSSGDDLYELAAAANSKKRTRSVSPGMSLVPHTYTDDEIRRLANESNLRKDAMKASRAAKAKSNIIESGLSDAPDLLSSGTSIKINDPYYFAQQANAKKASRLAKQSLESRSVVPVAGGALQAVDKGTMALVPKTAGGEMVEYSAKAAKTAGKEAAEKVAKKSAGDLWDLAKKNKVPQIALGVAATAWLVNKLSDSRGQQSNAQLYGQQGY